jgi:hypothetical protein
MGGRAALLAVVLVLAAGGGAGAAGAIEIGQPLHTSFRFRADPKKLSRSKRTPVRISIAGRNWTDDGSHVPAAREIELALDRHFALDVEGVPVCKGGSRQVRGATLEGCEDALVGRGTIEAEVAYPEEPMTTVTGSLRIYNRGRKPGGADLAGRAYFTAPITGVLLIPIEVRRSADGGRYGWRAHLEIPKMAGGYGSIVGYSARIYKRIFSATCGDGSLQVRAGSTFVDGEFLASTERRPCAVAEADSRQ